MKTTPLIIFVLLSVFTLCSKVKAQNNRDSLLNSLNLLLNENTPEANEKLLVEAKKLRSSNTEEDLVLANKIYKELGEDESFNELRVFILKKFPKGTTARQQAADEFLGQIDSQSPIWIERQHINWLKKFPPKEFDQKNRGTYDMVLMQIIKHYLSIERYDLVDKYKNTFIDQSLKTMTFYNIAEKYFAVDNLAESKIHIDSALSWSDAARQSQDMKVRSSFGAMMYNNIALLASQVDLKSGNANTAISLLPDILNKTNYQPMHGEQMIFTLAEAYKNQGANLDAFKVLENYIANNEDVDQVWESMHNLYLLMNGSEGNFAQFKDDVENVKNQKHLQTLKEKLIKKEAPNFELVNLEGSTVRLSDYKGKIVILDFWATWCVPCVRSFPAMQRLVEEYQDNQEIVFLFINTWEKQKDYKENVQKLIQSNKYTFHVLFDELSEKNNTLLSNQLGVPSLPTKVLIDKEGYVRLMLSGSDTNDKAIIKEVENLIKVASLLQK